MMQRTISAIAGLGILGLVIYFYDSYLLNLSIAIICIAGLWEILSGAGYTNKLLFFWSCAYIVIVMLNPWPYRSSALINHIFVIALMLTFLFQYKRLTVGELAVTVLFIILICYPLVTIVACRDMFGTTLGLYYNLIALIASWGADTGAYFSGRLFGRHKLAPGISPNKTIEGAVGGGIFGVAVAVVFSYLYAIYQSYMGATMTIHYGRLLCVLPVLVVSGMAGDLFASAVKRQFSIKDFGHIMPGHGGVLDRFDSVLAVAPMVYMVVKYMFPLASMA